ncbi:UDP-N-acetylmuramoyl-tripeptide--D-alanyl-D-alanine ligase [Streptacidiphilus sp. PB12-B1b]|uniref:UDP-N-acetylmuramoyl-tripeptide--D-alanyl-D- alanine ligase n=1 Tax=Streptacidiphilus sp. PB12-B1b TaxID=2705012 RepID=UPI0015FE4479|nr:UDP-N-acetylmuramoyl-tripeptide--D-alanyl-D-alanine ligase [Streptacidiphilus sp. PB12-B1b]QMU75909.1 UDP-N-acetylmuramoyl-tripeptide--D-alanyl-D-alanine ligase [Streptacidiphilus sp. PB12-B1b]
MIPLTLAEVAQATGGTLYDTPDPQAPVTGPVVHDSRTVEPGSLYVAVVGERVDGHDYAASAVADGAVAVLASRPVGVPAVVVEDVLDALARLARAVTARATGTTVIGLTGSAGKTSTKDLIAQLLGRVGSTVFTQGSFNNEIGFPITALRVEPSTRFLVLEMGARGKGHIAELTAITPPRIGLVLNVGTAHIGEFGGREAIAEAKGELVESLTAEGVAVLNADDPLVRAMASRTKARVVWFGESEQAHVRAQDVRLDASGRARFTLVAPGGSAPVALRLYGEHHVSNALGAAAVALECGLGVAETAAALGEAGSLSRWRMELTERPDGVTVINDAYNANPDSMRAALRALAAIGGRGPGARRTWAVLGEMRELGEDSLDEHDAVGRLAVRLNITTLVAVGGREAACMELGARNEGSWGEESVLVSNADAAIGLLREQVGPGDVVLVKASRSVGLERVAEALLADVPGAVDGASS